MNTTLVRYKVKADQAEQNKEYIRDVFAELQANKPDGFRYVSFNLADGLSFVHIAVIESDDDKNPLPETESFKKFISDIKNRCDEPPVISEADIVGTYRLFWQKLEDV